MKQSVISMVFMLMIMSAVTPPAYARFHRDADDRHHSAGDDYNVFCPWCAQESWDNANDAISGALNYRELYHMEFGEKHSVFLGQASIDQARNIAEDYIVLSNLPGLKVGEIIENPDEFDAEIIDRDGSIQETLTINRLTGEIRARQ